LTTPDQRNVNYLKIAHMGNVEAKEEVVQDEVNFVAVYQDFALSLHDFINA